MLDNLFYASYKYISLKYGLIRYPACTSFTVTGKCVSFITFLCIILIFCLYQPVLVRTFALICLYSLDFPILAVPGNMTYWGIGTFLISNLLEMGFSSKSVLISVSKSVSFLGISCKGVSVGLREGL